MIPHQLIDTLDRLPIEKHSKIAMRLQESAAD